MFGSKFFFYSFTSSSQSTNGSKMYNIDICKQNRKNSHTRTHKAHHKANSVTHKRDVKIWPHSTHFMLREVAHLIRRDFSLFEPIFCSSIPNRYTNDVPARALNNDLSCWDRIDRREKFTKVTITMTAIASTNWKKSRDWARKRQRENEERKTSEPMNCDYSKNFSDWNVCHSSGYS